MGLCCCLPPPPPRPSRFSFLSPLQVTFKKTKRRVKKIRKKEKEVVIQADDLLPLGDQTQDEDFGSRWVWGQGSVLALSQPRGQGSRRGLSTQIAGPGSAPSASGRRGGPGGGGEGACVSALAVR